MEQSLAPRVGEIVCGYRLLRALGSGARPRYVANSTKTGQGRRVVVELFDRTEDLARSARALVSLRHPKLVPVRNVVVEADRVAVESDFVDGEWLADLLESGWRSTALPLAALLRVLVDVLEGLSALHGACSTTREPLHLVHGEVAPASILVGADGVARLAHPLRSAAAAAAPPPEAIGYLAPEVLLHDQSADERADVFSAGVLLWEALAGRRLHSATHAGEIVVRLLGGKVQLPEPPPESLWAQPLAQAAKRALSPELAGRYASAAEMIAAVRWMSGEHLGSKQDVVALVESLAGARIRARTSGGAVWVTQGSSAPAPPTRSAAPRAEPPVLLAASSGSLRGDAPTPVPPRSWPVPPMKTGPAAEPDDSIDLVLESDRPTAQPELPAAPRVVPRAPPLPRLSLPTPIVPMTALAAFARTSSPPSTPPVPVAPPPPQSSTSPAVEVPPRSASSPNADERTDAPLALAALDDTGAPRPRSRARRTVVFVAAAAAFPALLGLAWLALGSSRPPPVLATQPPPPVVAASPQVPPAPAPESSPVVAEPAPSAPAPGSSSTASAEQAQAAPAMPPPAAASSAPAEAVAPPPLRKKSKSTYYPLGI